LKQAGVVHTMLNHSKTIKIVIFYSTGICFMVYSIQAQ